MHLRSFFRDLRGGKQHGRDGKNKQPSEPNHHHQPICKDVEIPPPQDSLWANLPPELLLDIISRVEAAEIQWPARRSVVSCASVCKTWREITKEVNRSPEQCGSFTFPISLKQPGSREMPIQCFIRRDRASSIYTLYFGLTPALSGNSSKFLMAAKRIRKATKTDFIISLSGNDFSETSENYAGKLRSNFLGSKFFIQDSEIPSNSVIRPSGWSWKRISSKRVSPRPPICSYNVATILYELNVLRTRGPRRIHCVMDTIPVSCTQPGGNLPPIIRTSDETFSPAACPSTSSISSLPKKQPAADPLVLENKVPRWHEQLQCWCLNFRGRVTVASVKNFQLVNAATSGSDDEKVILQFGKIGKDVFTMDFRYPLSAFQAFAICLSSFDTKPACE
ncbi:hypothetical protein M569_13507 [Genlisea aurea]|uniref:Tubby-like F-box protein n=1 Tax=Genlisea aurea TaxID=192259 RepID=S8DER4_9LAMI|nr:hypothetical protein M569_13507 [Genlisea aurea]